jgi:hypothetical protein
MIIEEKYTLECKRCSTDPWQKWGDENHYYNNEQEAKEAYELYKKQIIKFNWRIIKITREDITDKED